MLNKVTILLLISLTTQNVVHYHYHGILPKHMKSPCGDLCKPNQKCFYGSCQDLSPRDAMYQGPDAHMGENGRGEDMREEKKAARLARKEERRARVAQETARRMQNTMDYPKDGAYRTRRNSR